MLISGITLKSNPDSTKRKSLLLEEVDRKISFSSDALSSNNLIEDPESFIILHFALSANGFFKRKLVLNGFG